MFSFTGSVTLSVVVLEMVLRMVRNLFIIF